MLTDEIQKACEEGDVNRLVDILVTNQIDMHKLSFTDIQPLHTAAQYGHLDILKILIQFGADINSFDIVGDTALHIAVRVKNKELIRMLLDYDANPNLTNLHGETPIHLCVLHNDLDLLEELVDRGGNIFMPLSKKNILELARENGFIEIAEYIFKKYRQFV